MALIWNSSWDCCLHLWWLFIIRLLICIRFLKLPLPPPLLPTCGRVMSPRTRKRVESFRLYLMTDMAQWRCSIDILAHALRVRKLLRLCVSRTRIELTVCTDSLLWFPASPLVSGSMNCVRGGFWIWLYRFPSDVELSSSVLFEQLVCSIICQRIFWNPSNASNVKFLCGRYKTVLSLINCFIHI